MFSKCLSGEQYYARACSASVCLVSSVVHVHVQFPFVAALKGALAAAPGQTAGVLGVHVGNQGSVLSETHAAFTAPKRFLPSVDPHVRFEGNGLSEGHTAGVAQVGFLARVNSQVLPQVSHLVKPGAAHWTEPRAVLVHLIHVAFVGFLCPEAPGAFRARYRMLTLVLA